MNEWKTLYVEEVAAQTDVVVVEEYVRWQRSKNGERDVLLLLRPRRLRHERVRLLFLIQICVLDPLNALVPPSDYIKVR